MASSATKTKPKKAKGTYGLAEIKGAKAMSAPKLPYQPRDPKTYRPAIGLIGCGGITDQHLTAYKAAGYRVVALADTTEARANEKRAKFFPKAAIYTDYRELIARDDIEVVDIATHPPQRPPIIEAALNAKKHVLSQKPFVLDLKTGERLAELAEKNGVKLAVNQNGRWAPHFSYMRHAIHEGLIGHVTGAHLAVHWDHNWVAGTPFDSVKHVVLYDFAIHWFDILTCFMGERRPTRVYASTSHSPAQKAKPDLLGQVIVEYSDAQASLAFDADTRFGAQDTSYITGTQGTLTSSGNDLTKQKVELHTSKGVCSPKLQGSWFPDGFHGTMAELLCAIEEKREPYNSARNNLRSLALCFAAIASAEQHQPVVPGTVTQLPECSL
jgi:predicted dehydrogenase